MDFSGPFCLSLVNMNRAIHIYFLYKEWLGQLWQGLTALQNELMVDHMVPAACCLKFLTKLTNICIDCISAFSFNCDGLKTYFYFEIKVNGTDHTPPSQDPVSGGLQFRSDTAHLVLVKLSSVCKGPPGFLNRHWESWETRWQMRHRRMIHKTQRNSYKTFGKFNIFKSAGPDEIYLWVPQRNLPGQTV